MKNKAFPLLALACLATLNTPFSTAWAQNIAATVAPNIGGSDNSVDIQNTSGGDWYFFTSPTPSAAQMSRISGLSEFIWPSVGNFAPDPTDLEQDRIYPGEYLRVYPQTLAAGNLIQIAFSYTPAGTKYDFNVTVMAGAQVTALNILDANPTSAATVHWGVSFSSPVSGVTAANFAFNNPDAITGLAITTVTANSAQPSANWTVTASTGTGTGILGLNWTGHQSESPSVPNSFVGQYYDFSQYPIISQYPTNVGINVNSATTLSVVASLRGGGTPNYQWYSGTSVNPGAALAISGATSSTYTTPTFTSVGSFQYFCRVFTTMAYYTDSTTATVTVVIPPHLTSSPLNTTIATGQTATFSVGATGTSLSYQWYGGVSPNTTNPVDGYAASFTTPALSSNTSFWAQVFNAGPTVANSATATATVVTTLAASAVGYGATVGQTYPTAFAVTALDSANQVVANLPITFTAPGGSGPGGTFPGSVASVTVNTGANGVATAPQFTANEVPGNFTVTANFATLINNLSATNYILVTNAVVTNNTDVGPGSLRSMLALYPGGSAILTINFATNLSGATILLTNGPLVLDNSTTIDASALPAGLTLNGNQNGNVLYSSSGVTNVLTALTITNGNALGYYGGGVINFGALTVNRCTLAANTAYLGGGLFNYAGGTVTLNQCTVAGNSASDSGGGLFNYVGAMNVNQCTITGNSAASNYFSGGGGLNNYTGAMTLSNTIVTGNSALSATNIFTFASLNAGDNLTNGDPMLAALGNFGGPTPTMPPLPGSPAIDAGGPSPFTTDQRGYPRLVGLAPDIGAVEGVYNPAGPGQLTGATRLGNGEFQFAFTNFTDTSFTVLASANLAVPIDLWSKLGPAVESPIGSGSYNFTDPHATNNSPRFYRVVSP